LFVGNKFVERSDFATFFQVPPGVSHDTESPRDIPRVTNTRRQDPTHTHNPICW
jgi:hypothetical protein